MAPRHRIISFNGETLNITQWAAKVGISAQAIRYRLDCGWPIEEALTRRASVRGEVTYKSTIPERSRYQRVRAAEMQAVRREFNALVANMNRALNAFHNRFAEIAADDDTPGVVSDQDKNANDRMPRVAEDCA